MNWTLHIRKIGLLFLYMLQLQLSAAISFDLVSFNIRRDGKEFQPAHTWKRRLPYVAHFLNTTQPAIFCLQEPVLGQIEDIAVTCPDYAWFGTPRGTVWFNFGMAKNEYNPIFYKKSTFNLIAQGTFSINKPSLIVRRKIEGGLPRICTWGHFKEINSGQEFYIYNTHLDSEHDQARLNNLNVIINDIKQRVPANTPVFLMGDFNMDITQELQDILQEAMLEDTKNSAIERINASITHTSWKSGRSNYIDHIFVAHLPQNAAIAQHAVVQNTYPVEPSDHNPIKVTVAL